MNTASEATIASKPAVRSRWPGPSWRPRLLIGAAALGALGLLVVVAANALVLLQSDGRISSEAADVGHAQVAIVPGAMVNQDGTMSMMLADRVTQAEVLWQAGKVDRILVSGDHGQWKYDEPTTMRRALIASGVPASAIFTDHAGFNTHATMERARQIFGVDSAIVVTQGFHMKRSLYLAQAAGLEANGLTSDLHGYGGQGMKSDIREIGSRVKAVFDVVTGSAVTGGEPVPITGPAKASWGPEAPPGTPAAGSPIP